MLPNGKVLVAGGFGGSGTLASSELYDPASGTWSATGSLNTPRVDHTATLLLNGKVLVAAGINFDGFTTTAELYDPASGTWTATGDLNTERYVHTATLLPNGTVLVAGGLNLEGASASAELYDPANGNWTPTDSLNTARYQQTATSLPNGTVLVAGGLDSSGNASPSAELFTPETGVGANLVSAVSRLAHNSAGTFDIEMPLTGLSGVECRASESYEAVFTFDAAVSSGDVSVVNGTATAGTPTFSGNEVLVPLTGVANAQAITLRVENINGDGQSHGDVLFGFRIGDTNASRTVNAADVSQTKSQSGQAVTNANFREDVNLSGAINGSDVSLVKAHSGTALP